MRIIKERYLKEVEEYLDHCTENNYTINIQYVNFLKQKYITEEHQYLKWLETVSTKRRL